MRESTITSAMAIDKLLKKRSDVAYFSSPMGEKLSNIRLMNYATPAINRYAFLLDPKIGRLSETSPITILRDHGRAMYAVRL